MFSGVKCIPREYKSLSSQIETIRASISPPILYKKETRSTGELNYLNEQITEEVDEPLYASEEMKRREDEYEQQLAKFNPQYPELKRRYEELKIALDEDNKLSFAQTISQSQRELISAQKAIAKSQSFTDPNAQTLISLSDKDFDARGLITQDVRDSLKKFKFSEEDINLFETLHGIRTCTTKAKETLPEEHHRMLDQIIATSSLNKTDAMSAKKNLSYIRRDIDTCIKDEESKIQRAQQIHDKQKSSTLYSVCNFFKNLATAIRNPDKMELPFMERFKLASTISERNIEHMITRLDALKTMSEMKDTVHKMHNPPEVQPGSSESEDETVNRSSHLS